MSEWKSRVKDALRPAVSAMRQIKRQHEIRASAPVIDKPRLIIDLRALGLEPGDAIFLHSSLKSIGYVDGGATTVLEALVEAISPGGTLIVPTYYMPGGTILAACRQPGYVFDPRKHGTDLGALPAAFLKFPGVERSVHPTHSVSALGAHARDITGTHHLAPSVFGAGSPWERCLAINGKVLGLGVSMGPVTFYHLLEDMLRDEFALPVRSHETYRLPCRDRQGALHEVPVTPFVAHYAQRRIDTPARQDLRDYFWREFEGAGVLRTGRVGEARSWIIRSRDFYDGLVALMKQGITIYSTPEELERRPQR